MRRGVGRPVRFGQPRGRRGGRRGAGAGRKGRRAREGRRGRRFLLGLRRHEHDPGTGRGGTLARDLCVQGHPVRRPPHGPASLESPRAPETLDEAPPIGARLVVPAGRCDVDDEDCLYLDVYVPKPPPRRRAPVMVFVHGGAFVIGAASSGLYDGAKLASATGAIVVTINYRLGPFGFLSDAELRAEDPAHPSAGNYAIEDQIAALQWVKTNAASFGGDPANVTIFGESAGGTSMLVHLASPKSRGLFERAIVESAWTPYGGCAIPMATADQQGDAFATALGCTDSATRLACLRGKSPDDVLAALPLKAQGAIGTQGADWLPVIEGDVLPDEPLKLLAAGSFARVPVVIGNNTNEGSIFFDGNTTLVDDASYLAEEEAQYPGHGAAIVAQYPVAAFGLVSTRPPRRSPTGLSFAARARWRARSSPRARLSTVTASRACSRTTSPTRARSTARSFSSCSATRSDSSSSPRRTRRCRRR